MTIADVMVIDTGSYTMRVNNGVGVAEAVVQLIVTGKLVDGRGSLTCVCVCLQLSQDCCSLSLAFLCL